MKLRVTCLFLLFAGPKMFAQFNQTWMQERELIGGFNDTYMRVVGDNVLVHTTLFEGSSSQAAQSISTDGVETWFMTHSQVGACTNCISAGVESVAISSTGDAYGVGFQPSAPYGGRYVYKTNAAGNLEYAEEYFTSTFSGEFNDVRLSNDESTLFVFGDKYEPTYNTIVPHLFKINPSNGSIIQEAHVAPFGWAFPRRMVLDAADNVYLNASNVDTLRFSSYTSNLEFRWTDTVLFPEYAGSGEIPSLRFDNGDILFSTAMYNYLSNLPADKKLYLARYTGTGNRIWEHTLSFADYGDADRIFRDVTMDAQGNVYYYFSRIVSDNIGGIASEQAADPERGGKGGSLTARPEVFSFSPTGNFRYHYVHPFSGDIEYSEFAERLIADENGYLVASTRSEMPNAGMAFFLLSPTGNLEAELRYNQAVGSRVNGMVYAGNRTFYAQGISNDPDQIEPAQWYTAKFSYDYVTGLSEASGKQTHIVYPNPVEAGMPIRVQGLNASEPAQVLGADGRVWATFHPSSNAEFEIETAQLPAGMYVVVQRKQCARFAVVR